jgi:hypothetical protein
MVRRKKTNNHLQNITPQKTTDWATRTPLKAKGNKIINCHFFMYQNYINKNNTPLAFNGVRVAQSVVFCGVMFCRTLFVLFSSDQCF